MRIRRKKPPVCLDIFLPGGYNYLEKGRTAFGGPAVSLNGGIALKKLSELKTGSSLSFFKEVSPEVFSTLKRLDIDCFEYSFNFNYYMNVLDYTRRAGVYASMAAAAGVEQWSLHLPFAGGLDISNRIPNLRAITLYTNREIIRAAGAAGVKVIVMHPSSEPIKDEDRPERMALAREAIEILSAECEKAGCRLAVENLPRTCLCRTSDEMISLLSGTGAGMVFDTNHCLEEDNVHYIRAVHEAGIELLSLHISDYYRDADGVLDERHDLPGTGINDWKLLLDTILETGYSGPLMYEVTRSPKLRGSEITPEQLGENIKLLRQGRIG